MATIEIRGRKIKVQVKAGRQERFLRGLYEGYSNELLDQYEAESFPDRAIIRRALKHVDEAEQLLRSLLYDQVDRAEDALGDDPDGIPDYIDDDTGRGMLYPEHVNPELDVITHELNCLWMSLSEELGNTNE